MTGVAKCFVPGVAEYFVAGGARCFMAGNTECFVAGAAACFGGTFLIAHSVCHCPNLPHVLPHSYKWGNVDPMSISLQLALELPSHGELLLLWVVLLFSQWGRCRCWGWENWLVFLVSNRFSDADPVLGQGVLCLRGPGFKSQMSPHVM